MNFYCLVFCYLSLIIYSLVKTLRAVLQFFHALCFNLINVSIFVLALTLDKFYGVQDSATDQSEAEDLATVVKRRRINAQKEKEEKLKREREERIRFVTDDF
jgi:magnesium-transporting ATPase (P-type)